jgi:SAM-dependent methyltransferase
LVPPDPVARRAHDLLSAFNVGAGWAALPAVGATQEEVEVISAEVIRTTLRNTWNSEAADWIAWARSPELDDDFWQLHVPHFLNLLPPPGKLTVDMGCGEGRLGRILTRSGYHVIGFDTALPLVRAAAVHPEGHPVAVADAARLPVRDGLADLVVAFMCLHDFDDLRGAVEEAARVLAPDGRLCIALHHPLMTSKLAGDYQAEQRYAQTVAKPGHRMTYHGVHRPLATYAAALESAGFLIEALREPVKTTAGRQTVPFLHLRCVPANAGEKSRSLLR